LRPFNFSDILHFDVTKQQLQEYQKEVERVVQLLKEKYKPEKIILFDSMVNQTLGENGDIDLLVIKDTNKSYNQRNKEVALICASYIPKDIFV